jgi:hypothetical protein
MEIRLDRLLTKADSVYQPIILNVRLLDREQCKVLTRRVCLFAFKAVQRKGMTARIMLNGVQLSTPVHDNSQPCGLHS